MRNLLNFGVSDPLTLGMAHPVADRLETLGRARPVTRRSRALALGAMSVLALSTAPLSIAAGEPERDIEIKVVTNGQSYEIVSEDGENKAYQILKGGERKEVDLERKEDGSYQLTYSDGKTVALPNIDMEAFAGLEGLAGLEALKALEGLEGLSGLEGLAALKGLEGLSGLESLKSLESLEGLEKLEKLKQLGLTDGDVHVLTLNGGEAKLPEAFREMLGAKGGDAHINIVRGGEPFRLADTVVGSRIEFFKSSNPLETALHQLELAKRQLESLKTDESVSFDLENALRDLESAQDSLAAAEARLRDRED